MNNYETLEQCQGAAITGACCYRQYSLKVEDVIDSAQNEEFGCKVSDNILVLSDKKHKFTQILISQTLISPNIFLYQRIKVGQISYFSLHFSFCHLKLLISQCKFSGTRKLTLRYQ